jgi:hypothetical protein
MPNTSLKPISALLALGLPLCALQAAPGDEPAARRWDLQQTQADKAAQAAKITVAVLEPFASKQVDPAHKRTLRAALEEAVSAGPAGPDYAAVNRARLDKAFADDKKLRDSLVGGVPDEKSTRKIGSLTGAGFVLATDLYRDGAYYNLTCWLIDAETCEARTANGFIETDAPQKIHGVAAALVVKLLGQVGPPKNATAVTAEMASEMADAAVDAAALMAATAAAEETEPMAAAEAESMAAAEAARVAAAAAREAALAAARESIEDLAPHFSFEKREWPATAANRELAQLADRQRQTVIAKKSDAEYALVAEIAGGRLRATSKYAYRGEANRLSHNRIVVTANGESRSVRLVPTKGATSAGASVGTEEAELSDAAVLRLIARATGQVKVQIENEAGFFKSFALSGAAQRAIAQTVELCDAMELVGREGAAR